MRLATDRERDGACTTDTDNAIGLADQPRQLAIAVTDDRHRPREVEESTHRDGNDFRVESVLGAFKQPAIGRWPGDSVGEMPELTRMASSLAVFVELKCHVRLPWSGRPFMKRIFLVAAATSALCTPAPAQSYYPNKPVKLIVDSAPGSATDVINRLVSERLAQIWGQQVLTLNHPGAGGSIAVRTASQAEPDGTTFFVGNASVFLALKGEPGVAPNLPVELPRDFTTIGFIAQQPMFIAVAPQLGIKSLPELIEAAKKRPGALSYATTGRGRITHLTMELLQSRAGIALQM